MQTSDIGCCCCGIIAGFMLAVLLTAGAKEVHCAAVAAARK